MNKEICVYFINFSVRFVRVLIEQYAVDKKEKK